jgi:hypothetical protein
MESKKDKGIYKQVFSAFFALFVFFSSAYLFAQQSRKAEVIRSGQECELKIDQEVTIDGEDLAVVFESVTEDSRCPEGVDCVWSGNANIHVRTSKSKQASANIELNTDRGPKSSSYLNYEIRLVALKPNRKPDVAIRPEEYRATLIISKK